ncbi:MAG: metallophosphoesterase family protein [Thermoanaerobaculia bacterium]
MRYLILTDIHGNSDALDAVLEEASTESIGSVLVLGDLVGYGAGPNEVIDRILGLPQPTVVIRGNHDKVVATPIQDLHFNAIARLAIRWTAEELTDSNLRYLSELPQGPLEIKPGLSICHGSPLDEDEYLLGLEGAADSFANHPARISFFGHTHLPTLFVAENGRLSSFGLEGEGQTIHLEPGNRYLANPGSVGQPRDRDPRAAYFIYDAGEDKIHWRRCDYAVGNAQRRILEAGLPEVLAYRLAAGI